jgi:hypothetical protein
LIFPFSGVHDLIPELLFPIEFPIEASSFAGETVALCIALGIMLLVNWVPTMRVWLNVFL